MRIEKNIVSELQYRVPHSSVKLDDKLEFLVYVDADKTVKVSVTEDFYEIDSWLLVEIEVKPGKKLAYEIERGDVSYSQLYDMLALVEQEYGQAVAKALEVPLAVAIAMFEPRAWLFIEYTGYLKILTPEGRLEGLLLNDSGTYELITWHDHPLTDLVLEVLEDELKC